MKLEDARRVVLTGLGVLSPNAHGVEEFEEALRAGRSGIRANPELTNLGFACQVAGLPDNLDGLRDSYFDSVTQLGMDRYTVLGCIAALDCWRDAGLTVDPDIPDWDTSIVFGSGIGGLETSGKVLVPMTDAGRVRRMGSVVPERVMASAASARIAGLVGAGGQVTSNSSACSTSTESLLLGYWAIREGRAQRVLAGGCEGDSPYIWAGFDAMRVLSRNFNDRPAEASRPLSATANGFVPAAGAGAVMLESLASARDRGARIYAEVAGGAVNCGGQRNGGTMTAGNPEGVQRCIQAAMRSACVAPAQIDLISGHLTATQGDRVEVRNWRRALCLPDGRFPLLNAPKSLLGHALGAAGAMECVACILQLRGHFVHPSLNCEDLHPEIAWCDPFIPRTCVERELRVVAKASFGFGDVNSCILFRKFNT
ncbi:MAG: beta-ketoacyl-[acyl-carrier-protein] synthase family protein [Candidatus Solibacter sp.]